MPYTYIARRRLLVGDTREPGELVPEAAAWPNLRNYLEIGWVEKIALDDPEAIAASTTLATAPASSSAKEPTKGQLAAARMRAAKAAKQAQTAAA